jgi:hypothetical protein
MGHVIGSKKRAWVAGAAVGALAAAGMLRPAEAHACGGFFCSQTAPVDQSGEEIIFIDNPDDTVTAIISIDYEGPSEHFAWVLPIDGAPDKVDVSSSIAFANLKAATDPQYILSSRVEGTCKAAPMTMAGFGGQFASAPSGASLDAGTVASEPSISVISQGSVGPYDWTVISVSEKLDDPASVAVDWLTANGYDLTSLGPEVLRPYLADGLDLIAFKLSKPAETQTGTIRPVVLTFKSKLPVIPIRPTAVAAKDDMGVLVWVLGQSQAVPQNYKSLVLNEALINWFQGQYNPASYRGVVTAAANEAGGQGFVTEMAGSTKQLGSIIWPDYLTQQWQQYANTTFADGFDMISQAGSYRDWDGYRDAIRAATTLPADVAFDDFGRNPDQYRGVAQIDQAVFLKELYEHVVRPVIKTQELIDGAPYFTRLFSTMSADEMTADPAFDFNPDLADVSNQHNAMQIIECSSSVLQSEAPWRIVLPQGGVIRGKGYASTWPYAPGGDLPANYKIVELTTKGAGVIAQDNSKMIADALFTQSGMKDDTMAPEPPKRGVPIGGDEPASTQPKDDTQPSTGSAGSGTMAIAGDTMDTTNEAKSTSGDGCSVGRAGGAADVPAWLLLAVGAISMLARRRRSHTSR